MRRRCPGGSRRCGTVRAGVSCSAELVAAESAATRRGRYASQIDVAPRDESRGRGHAASVSAAPEAVNTGCAVRGEAPGPGADGGHTTALQPPTWPLNCAVISSRRGARRSPGTRRRAPGGPSDFIRPQCGGEAATGAAQNRPTGTGSPVGRSAPACHRRRPNGARPARGPGQLSGNRCRTGWWAPSGARDRDGSTTTVKTHTGDGDRRLLQIAEAARMAVGGEHFGLGPAPDLVVLEDIPQNSFAANQADQHGSRRGPGRADRGRLPHTPS